MSQRVVVTGLGVVSPVGIGKDVFWAAVLAGQNGIGPITHFDASQFSTRIAGQVNNFEPSLYMDRKEARRMVKFIQFAVASAKLAAHDAGLVISDTDSPRAGVMIGTGIGGVSMLEEQAKVLAEKGPSRISPHTVPYMICDMAAGVVSMHLNAKGPNSCVVTACASSTHAIGDAFRLIRAGDADVMFAGGTEAAITPLSVGGFAAARALSERNDDPAHASRPFDKERDGFVMGEGSGMIVLESLEHAMARKAHVYAEVIGYGLSGDAYHITSPDPSGDGARRGMEMALKDAKVAPTDVNYINAHGTSTEINDKVETAAIKQVFGDYAYKIPVSSTKSMIGHLLGAAGSVEFVAAVMSIVSDKVHPTINTTTKDPNCDLDYVPNTARDVKVNIAMSNSFGFGGHNAILIAKKFQA